jgi:hypothetical protein
MYSALTLRDASKIFAGHALHAPWQVRSTAKCVVAVENVSHDKPVG